MKTVSTCISFFEGLEVHVASSSSEDGGIQVKLKLEAMVIRSFRYLLNTVPVCMYKVYSV